MNRIRDLGAGLVRWGDAHIKWAWMLFLVPLMFWANDRKPPFEVTRYYQPAAVAAGSEITFVLDVDRDVTRDCSARVSRQLKDSTGSTRQVTSGEVFSSAQIASLERDTPDQLRRTFIVPTSLPPGKAVLLTEIEYRCGLNPLHAIWPIGVFLEWPFDVLPAKPVPPLVIIDRRDSR